MNEPLMPDTPTPPTAAVPMTPVFQQPAPPDADMTPAYPMLKGPKPQPAVVAKPCGILGCGGDATHQFQRRATPTEAAAHWDAMENDIRKDVPGYVQDRSGEVLISEFRCDHPEHASAVYLDAQTKEDN